MEDETYDAAVPASENPTAILVTLGRDLLMESLQESATWRFGVPPGELPREITEEICRQAMTYSSDLEDGTASSEDEGHELVL
jgi:hypothetical protein